MAASILVIVPAHNESSKIGQVLASIPAEVRDEVLVVDDGSTDGTGDEARATGAQVLRCEPRQGVGNAIRSGYGYAREHGFSVAVTMAGNTKDDGHQIPLLTGPIASGDLDFVQGSRYLQTSDRGAMPLYRRLATQTVHPLLFSWFSGRRLTDSTNGFRAVRTRLLDDPRIDLEQPWLRTYELEVYLLFRAVTLGYRFTEVPVRKVYPPRAGGYTKMVPFRDWWRILRPVFLLGLGLRR